VLNVCMGSLLVDEGLTKWQFNIAREHAKGDFDYARETCFDVSLAMVWPSMAPQVGMAQQTQPASTTQKAAQPRAETVKPIAACGSCLKDGTKVPLTLGRERTRDSARALTIALFAAHV
jgi:hypothetical protein